MTHAKQRPRRQPDRRLLGGGNELAGGSGSDPDIRRLVARTRLSLSSGFGFADPGRVMRSHIRPAHLQCTD